MRPKVTLLKSRVFKTGGLEKYTLKLAERFAEKGCDVTVLTTGELPPTLNLPYKVISTQKKSKNLFSFSTIKQFDRQCQEWLKKNPASIVFGMDRNSFQTHYRAGNGVHAEYLKRRSLSESWFKRLSFNINPLHKSILKFEKQTYENPELQRIFTNSEMVKKEILAHYQTPENIIKVVHNGVEWSELELYFNNWKQGKKEFCQHLKLNEDTFHFLFIGNGYRRKGLENTLEAIAKLKISDFHLSVVGKDNEINLFKNRCHKLGISDKVTFFGPRNDVRNFYQLADALLIPSTYDPFSNVTVEALAMGLFVVSSKFNGGCEVLNSQNGHIISDLDKLDDILHSLQIALRHPKSVKSSTIIRESVKHLEFNNQLDQIISETLNSIP